MTVDLLMPREYPPNLSMINVCLCNYTYQVSSLIYSWCGRVVFLLFICSGNEPAGESVVQLVCRNGGVAVLAHPWALKNPVAVIKDLKAAGLHGIEVYRSDGKLSGMNKDARKNKLF